jgi:Conserved hypothetical protein 2217 (DUF2460)
MAFSSLPLYPYADPTQFLGLGYKVKWSPIFFNQSVKTLTGASVDIRLAPTPLHAFELTYPFARSNNASIEFENLYATWVAIGGQAGRFAFLNPDDASVTTQAIASRDGVTASYTIVRSFPTSVPLGLTLAQVTEPVGIVQGPGFGGTPPGPKVYYNGVLQTSGTNYTIDGSVGARQLLNLITIPPLGQSITMTFAYYYYCKFADDSLTFEKWAQNIWSAQTVKIQSCRPGA